DGSNDGQLDPAFGEQGTVLFRARQANEVHALELPPPDPATGYQSILVCGVDTNPDMKTFANDFVVARLDHTGRLDPGFGNSCIPGVSLVDFTQDPLDPHGDLAWDLVRQADGKIVVVGETRWENYFQRDYAVARLTATGQLDADPVTGFSGDGKQPLDLECRDFASGGALRRGEAGAAQFVLGGQSIPGDGMAYMAGARLTADGSMDQAFNSRFPDTIGHGDQVWGVEV